MQKPTRGLRSHFTNGRLRNEVTVGNRGVLVSTWKPRRAQDFDLRPQFDGGGGGGGVMPALPLAASALVGGPYSLASGVPGWASKTMITMAPTMGISEIRSIHPDFPVS